MFEPPREEPRLRDARVRYMAQERADTCGIASARMIIERVTGQDIPERELMEEAQASGAFNPGTGLYTDELPGLLRAHGVNASQPIPSDIDYLASNVSPERPAIVSVSQLPTWDRDSPANHAVVVEDVRVEADGSRSFLLHNPALETRWMPENHMRMFVTNDSQAVFINPNR